MKLFYCIIFSLVAFYATIAQTPTDSAYAAKLSAPGVQMIPVYGGKYKVFTQKIGNGKTKLLLLSGGPGQSYEYFENFPTYLQQDGITVYFYEQLGNYYSDHPDDSSIWHVDRFVEEVEEVRKGLGIDNFYILGHSWGGMLGVAYAAKYGAHLKGLILSNIPGFPTNDTAYFNKVMDSLETVVRLKTIVLNKFAMHKTQVDSVSRNLPIADTALQSLLSRQFRKADDSVWERTLYYSKEGEWPDGYQRSKKHYRQPGGDKYHFDVFNVDYPALMKQITTPTLLLGSKFDFLHDELYYGLAKEMKNAPVRVYICPKGEHFVMWSDPEDYFDAIKKFITDVNKHKFIPGN